MSVQIGQWSSARAGNSLPAGSTATASAFAGWTANSAEAWPETGAPPSRWTCPNESTSWTATANSARYEPHLERDRNQPIVVALCASLGAPCDGATPPPPATDVSYNVTLSQSADPRFPLACCKKSSVREARRMTSGSIERHVGVVDDFGPEFGLVGE